MAKLVLTGAVVQLAGTDISSSVAAITLTTSAAEVPTTNFGSSGAVTRVSGLIDNSVTLSFHNSYNDIDGLIFPLIGSTATTLNIFPNGTSLSTAAPKYAMSVLCNNWTPVNGAVGELNTADVTWPVSGAITKSTS